LGEVRLDDDERFSTVSLNAAAARDSTVAVKSPIDEAASKPWTEDEPPPAPSEVSSASMRASFLLQRLENDAAPGPRRSLDGQQKLQEVFERAQRNSKDLEDDAGVDWGKCSLGSSVDPAPLTRTVYSVLGFSRVRCVSSMLLLPYSNGERIDYQGFASENSGRLARAIEKGIPSNLRGMVWQLM
jgi:hypothetical protein